jgi:hypothetical protein
MEPHDEKLNDKELSGLLHQWQAPEAPDTLRLPALPQPVSPQDLPWWRWLLTGSIRVPVPVGVAAVVVLALWIIFGRPAPAPPHIPDSATLANFTPVEQLEPTIVERNDDDGSQQQYK